MVLTLILHMHMMPCTVPCTSVPLHIACVWGVWSMSEIARCWFSVTQRTIPGLWNLYAFYFWTVSRSLLALLSSTVDWPLCFSFVSCQLCSAHVSALDSAKYIYCKCPAALSVPSAIAKKCCPPQLYPPSTLQWHPTLRKIDIPNVSANWHF